MATTAGSLSDTLFDDAFLSEVLFVSSWSQELSVTYFRKVARGLSNITDDVGVEIV